MTYSRTSSRYKPKISRSILLIPLNLDNQERKYFDSGDYALSKAGKASDVGVTQVGREHPVPENIPHSSSPHTLNGNHILNPILGHGKLGQSGSPVKESSFLQRETSVADMEAEEEPQQEEMAKKEEGDEGSEHAKNRPVAIQQ
jgi:hypothetical protein